MLRTTRPVAPLLAVVLATVPAIAACGQSRPEPTATASTPPFADRAWASLPATKSAVVASDRAAVGSLYHQYRSSSSGALTVWLSCAGYGQVMLVVSGQGNGEAGGGEYELAHPMTVCTDDPEPVRADFSADDSIGTLVFDIKEAETARGRAGFAFRVTHDPEGS